MVGSIFQKAICGVPSVEFYVFLHRCSVKINMPFRTTLLDVQNFLHIFL